MEVINLRGALLAIILLNGYVVKLPLLTSMSTYLCCFQLLSRKLHVAVSGVLCGDSLMINVLKNN